MWQIKQIRKMKSQHSSRSGEKRETVQPVQQRRINIQCVQKFVSAGHEGGGRRAAAAPRIDPFPFLRDSYSRRSATTATCLPIGKRAFGKPVRDGTPPTKTVTQWRLSPSVRPLAVTFCSPRMADRTQRDQTQRRWINTISRAPCLGSACTCSI